MKLRMPCLPAVVWLMAGLHPAVAKQPECCQPPAASRYAPAVSGAPEGMVWIPGGEFTMGSGDADARADEKPAHRVRVEGFWMDVTPVTNAQFRKFVEATGYLTTAEKAPDLAEIMKQLPPGAPPPPKELLVPAGLVFQATSSGGPLHDVSQWWTWCPGANWRHPEGPGSTIEGRDDWPVVQVSWDDAVAYAKWAGKRLPTEAEWEYAARGGLEGKRHAWGDDDLDAGGTWRANTWQGDFPVKDEGRDGFAGRSPVRAFPANGYGLHDMAGNVWQWVADWYRPDTYAKDAANPPVGNPAGPSTSHDPDEPFVPKRVIRGGSFLCNASYCSGYRVSARMRTSPDTGTNHIGFRCVRDAEKTVSATSR